MDIGTGTHSYSTRFYYNICMLNSDLTGGHLSPPRGSLRMRVTVFVDADHDSEYNTP